MLHKMVTIRKKTHTDAGTEITGDHPAPGLAPKVVCISINFLTSSIDLHNTPVLFHHKKNGVTFTE